MCKLFIASVLGTSLLMRNMFFFDLSSKTRRFLNG